MGIRGAPGPRKDDGLMCALYVRDMDRTAPAPHTRIYTQASHRNPMDIPQRSVGICSAPRPGEVHVHTCASYARDMGRPFVGSLPPHAKLPTRDPRKSHRGPWESMASMCAL